MTNTKENLISVIKNFKVGEPRAINFLDGGLINKTFFVETDKGKYILQQMHDILPAKIIEDIEFVTTHIENRKMITPKLVRTTDDNLSVNFENKNWRMMTFIDGVSFEALPDPELAESAGRLIGKFHANVLDIDYEFKNRFDHWHDTPMYINQLKEVSKKYAKTDKGKRIEPLVKNILSSYKKIVISKNLPQRVVHGDLKISNVMFEPSGKKAIGLVDLDTMGRHPIVLELGDVARSWCNLYNEGHLSSSFDLRTFKYLMKGYIPVVRNIITPEELYEVPAAALRISLELSSRFATDAFLEERFRLKRDKYDSLYDQNVIKSVSQFLLFKDILKKQNEMKKIIKTLIS